MKYRLSHGYDDATDETTDFDDLEQAVKYGADLYDLTPEEAESLRAKDQCPEGECYNWTESDQFGGTTWIHILVLP